jgi:hypothetical protein
MQFAERQRVTIRATERRPLGKPDYYIVLSRNDADRLGLDTWGVLAFLHPALTGCAGHQGADPFTAIHCRLEIRNDTPESRDDAPPCVAVDQTLRNALGIPFRVFKNIYGGNFFLLPGRRSGLALAKRSLAEIFGIRYLAFRCQSAHVPDIEKNYVRVPADALKALAAQEGDELIIERPVAVCDQAGTIGHFIIGEVRMSTLAASDRFIDDRARIRRSYPDRYPDAQAMLYDYEVFRAAGLLCAPESGGSNVPEPDVPPIFMDADTRALWTSNLKRIILRCKSDSNLEEFSRNPATFVTAMMVRRSIRSALARDSIQTGIAFLIVLIQFTLAMDLDPNRVSLREILVSLVVAIIVSTMLLIARLRQQV